MGSRNEGTKGAFVHPCLAGKALNWEKPNTQNYAAWPDVVTRIQLYNRCKYMTDRAHISIDTLT